MDRPAKPAKAAKTAATTKKTPTSSNITLKPEQFRSMILDKLRLDIDAKRAAYEQAKKLAIKDLGNMSYWKMKYWKMKYWKMGADVTNPAGPVINPALLGKAARKRVK